MDGPNKDGNQVGVNNAKEGVGRWSGAGGDDETEAFEVGAEADEIVVLRVVIIGVTVVEIGVEALRITVRPGFEGDDVFGVGEELHGVFGEADGALWGADEGKGSRVEAGAGLELPVFCS